jgi:hypothetical protein
MNFKKKAIIIAIALMFIPFTNVFANTITISHTAGYVYGTVSGSQHRTKYSETRINYSACANSAAEYSDYGDSECAYLTTSNNVWVIPASGYGHYHLYVAFAGIPDGIPAGSKFTSDYTYNISQFTLYH